MPNKITFTQVVTKDGREQTKAEFEYDNLDDIETLSIKKLLIKAPEGNVDITTTQQTDVAGYATAQVVDADLVDTNIKEGVNILGIQGTFNNEDNIYGELLVETFGGT